MKIFIGTIWLFILILTGCREEKPAEDEPIDLSISYHLDRTATGQTQNSLLFKFDSRAGYKFLLSGEGFSADLPLNTILPLKERTILSYQEIGSYNVDLTIFQKDGSVLIEDSLSWEYNTEQPKEAVLSFQEKATNKNFVVMYISSNRGADVNHVSIVGDVDPRKASEDNWYEIPSTGEVIVPLSEGDGVKKFKVKMRNRYYNETNEVDLEIIKKTSGPKNCQAVPISNFTASDEIEFFIAAEDPYPLYYKVIGEGARQTRYKEFSKELYEFLVLTNGNGEKPVEIIIKDIAENYCETIKHVITVDPDYQDVDLSIEDDRLWTDVQNIMIFPHFDHFAHILTEMYISGAVVDDEKTFEWIPFQENLEISLLPEKGHRTIDIAYRDARGQSGEKSQQIFLKPFLIVKGVFPDLTILPSPIYHLESMSIQGCLESYEEVNFEFSLPCTAQSSEITAIYKLTSGEELVIKTSL